jgi:glycosyltransferase involved in cell wall biosynthesis
VIRDGISGYLVHDVEGAVRAAGQVASLSRRGCRSYFEERFLVERMAEDYLALYQKLMAKK